MAICRRRRADHHQPLSIEFVDGPIAGVHDIPEVRLEASVLLISDHKLFRGVGDPAAVAVYTLAELDGKSRWLSPTTVCDGYANYSSAPL
jgi:hypothetical protein